MEEMMEAWYQFFKREKYLLLLPLGCPRWILGFGHLDMPKISFEPGFPRDSEAAQTARRNDQGTELGGILRCDAQLR